MYARRALLRRFAAAVQRPQTVVYLLENRQIGRRDGGGRSPPVPHRAPSR